MTIPKSKSDTIFLFAIMSVVILFFGLGIFNLINRVAVIASSIWIGFVAMIVWTSSKREGGFCKFLANSLGALVGRDFVEIHSPSEQLKEIRFGYELFGRRFIRIAVAAYHVESVEWTTGQASAMAGRDMNDWHVCLWFDHNDPIMAAKHKGLRKPSQEVYCVGPSRKREATEAFGLFFVDFLLAAGVQLKASVENNRFIRKETHEIKS